MHDIRIESLTTIEQLTEMNQLEEKIWNMPPVPVHQTFTAVKNGGICLGAYDQDRMIGFLYSFAGFNSDSYLCSHMLGFLESYRKMGLGEKMKREQAILAKEAGYPLITWTFDPLESVNAYVNIHKLGAMGHSYSTDHYGKLTDGLNEGLPTDRMIIHWDLLNPKQHPSDTTDAEPIALLHVDENRKPVVATDFETMTFDDDQLYAVIIPDDFQTIKAASLKQAQRWRLDSRLLFHALFSRGYQAIDVEHHAEQRHITYVFAQPL